VTENLKELFVLSFFLALHFIFFIFAVKDTTILNATVLVNTTPLFSVLVSNYIFKLSPSRMAILGLAISFVGVCIIASAEAIVQSGNSGGLSPSLKGDLEAVLAALVEALYLNYGRKIRNQMNILSIMLPIYALTAFVVLVLSLPVKSAVSALTGNVETALLLLGLGLLPTAAAHTLYFSSLSNLKSFETATMALLEPIGATLLGVAIFQEVPAPVFALGAAMILAGIVFVGKNKSQR
jgi:drug/metabolite transporter (DMT)-like permease